MPHSKIDTPMARILVAEDEPAVRAFVARALSQSGHNVTVATDGSEAARELDLARKVQMPFDLLLTDIVMPGMDGIALALLAARDAPDMKIILMTGFADQKERAHRLDAIIEEVLLKPFEMKELLACVSAVLEG